MSDDSEKPAGTTGQKTVSADSNAKIATKLKSLYDTVEQEPIPDLFLDLLEQLDKAERDRQG